jgi:hypothetical protein
MNIVPANNSRCIALAQSLKNLYVFIVDSIAIG